MNVDEDSKVSAQRPPLEEGILRQQQPETGIGRFECLARTALRVKVPIMRLFEPFLRV